MLPEAFSSRPMFHLLKRVPGFDSHHRFALAISAAVLAVLLTPGLRWVVRAVLSWDAFALASLALSWAAAGVWWMSAMGHPRPRHGHRHNHHQRHQRPA